MTDKIYIARGPFCWGTGTSPRKALQNAKRHLTFTVKPGQVCFTVDHCSPDTYVNEMGGLNHPQADPKPKFIGYYDINFRAPTEMP